jgi:hypothetical protein
VGLLCGQHTVVGEKAQAVQGEGVHGRIKDEG